jgi:integrase
MPKIKLEASIIPTLYCPVGKSNEKYFDQAIIGFLVEARPTGATYALRYKDGYGRQRQYKIAAVGDISFAAAKKEAIRVKGRVSVGKNPAEERQANRRILTVSELSVRYLDYARTYKRSHDIDERYLRLHLLPRFGRLYLNQLDQTEIMEWMNSKVKGGYAQATVNRWQVIMGHMMRMAHQWGLPGAEINPMAGVKQKDPENHVERYLSPAETQRLKEEVENSPNFMLRYIVALLLLTGCRKRELLDAKWEDINIDRKSWRIPRAKTKMRYCPLSEDAINVLQSIPRFDDCPYVVPNPETLLPFISVYNSWNHARKRAGLPDVRMHDLRHSAASNLVNAGQSLYVVARVLGHTQTKTSERYAHLAADTLLQAVNAASSVTGTTWGEVLPMIAATASPAM